MFIIIFQPPDVRQRLERIIREEGIPGLGEQIFFQDSLEEVLASLEVIGSAPVTVVAKFELGRNTKPVRHLIRKFPSVHLHTYTEIIPGGPTEKELIAMLRYWTARSRRLLVA